MSPAVAPIKGDTGGSLRSIASSCPASPPTSEATTACQMPSPCGSNSCAESPNTARRTSKAIMTAKNAVTMDSHTWFVNTRDNTRATSAPLNAPVRTIARTVAEALPSTRAILFRASQRYGCQRSITSCSKSFPSDRRQSFSSPAVRDRSGDLPVAVTPRLICEATSFCRFKAADRAHGLSVGLR